MADSLWQVTLDGDTVAFLDQQISEETQAEIKWYIAHHNFGEAWHSLFAWHAKSLWAYRNPDLSLCVLGHYHRNSHGMHVIPVG